MKQPTNRPGRDDSRSPQANAWESRLLALNALVELAREHAAGRISPGDHSYRLEHALGRIRQAVCSPRGQDEETVDAAVTAFGDALASLGHKNGQRR